MRYARMSYMCWCLSMQSERAASFIFLITLFHGKECISCNKSFRMPFLKSALKTGWRAPSVTGITRCQMALWTIGNIGSFLAFIPLIQLSHYYSGLTFAICNELVFFCNIFQDLFSRFLLLIMIFALPFQCICDYRSSSRSRSRSRDRDKEKKKRRRSSSRDHRKRSRSVVLLFLFCWSWERMIRNKILKNFIGSSKLML